MAQEPAIFIDQLNKYYKENWVIKNLSLTVNPGEVFALVGPNGAGKTTTIRVLMGLTKATSGTVRVLGLDPQKQAAQLKARTGYAMQQIALDLYLTGRENLAIFCDLFNIPAQHKTARIKDMLEWARLTDAADRLVQTYSGGMKRRLNLLIGLLHNPDLLFLDEPTLGLDVQARRQLWDLIADIKSRGTTIILTTHYLEEANALCDRVGIMAAGRLAALGTPADLKRDLVRDLYQLAITFEPMPSLADFDFPIQPTITGNRMHFTGPHDVLWQIMGQLQNEFGDQVREAAYLQPTLDDVVLKISQLSESENQAGEA